MSTVTQAPASANPPQRATRPAYKVTALRVLRSEWSKFWSLRSAWITLGLALLFVLAFGLIASARYKSQIDAGGQVEGHFADATAVSLALFGVDFAQLALGVLGVLVTAGEYSTGMIRSTLAAVPRRLPVLWSKAAVYGLVALAVGSLGALIAFKIGSHFVAGTPVALSLSSPGVVRSLLGAGLYLALVGVIGIALGALLRSAAAGIAVLVAVLLLVPGLVALLPASWEQDISPYLPSNAGESMYTLSQAASALSPTAGLAALLGWTALALAGAAYRLMRSDA
ncbi:ABC transporter permease subunit [Streptomyces sp. TRM68367]|uniref:ABC transporter permease subunit n=1 Tax=Streptomyces sp. TRM68367 TaxID=2758415 RepID=UPI00165C58B5|nr:ABC transporter permease subunit [Streptomyces sp. TRM68367]MBC9723901.1 ABC transporter permease subunit [Streptomyces sp. TRM68367]